MNAFKTGLKTVVLMVLLTLVCPAQAVLFGYEEPCKQYSLVVSADIKKVDAYQLYPVDASKRQPQQYPQLANFVNCMVAKRATCFSNQVKNYQPGLNRFSYMGYLESLEVHGVLQWGDNISYLVKYKAQERRYKHSDIVTFQCFAKDICWAMNNLQQSGFANSSVGYFDLLSSIFSVYKNEGELKHKFKQRTFSRFNLLGPNSGVDVYVNWQMAGKTSKTEVSLQTLMAKVTQCKQTDCDKTAFSTMMSSFLGNEAAQNFYPLSIVSAEAVPASGFVDFDNLQQLFRQWDSCTSALTVTVKAVQRVVLSCAGKGLNDYLILPFRGGQIAQNHIDYTANVILSSLASATLTHQIIERKAVPYRTQAQIFETPGVNISAGKL